MEELGVTPSGSGSTLNDLLDFVETGKRQMPTPDGFIQPS
jgi:hypothetical protein